MTQRNPVLSRDELAFYSRQLGLDGFGAEGQARLRNASVLVIGAGGLGSPCALYLAAAGVGRLGLVDFDDIDVSNLHRQILYSADQVGQAKIDRAADRLRSLNPHVRIEPIRARLTRDNARETIRAYDLVADGADNFATRYLVNDACVLENRPLVSASVLGFEGQLSVFNFEGGPCYRCLYPQPPPPGAVPSCAEGGVLGVLPGLLGTMQALETIKCLAGIGQPASGVLVHVDALTLEVSRFGVPKNRDCTICAPGAPQTDFVDYEALCAGAGMNQANAPEVTPDELRGELADDNTELVVLDVREAHERAVDAIEGSVHIPLAAVLSDGVPYDPSRRIVVYCAAGGRSMQAANSLIERGYRNVASLATGLTGFRSG